MNIAIVGPSPIPFILGGAEKLLTGLHYFGDQKSSHCLELIKVPIREDTFWDTIHAYRTFYEMDLSQFDAIISQKYPAWMIRHSRHSVYMLHRLRGLYDLYPKGMSKEVDTQGVDKIESLLEYMDGFNVLSDDLHGFFDKLQQIEIRSPTFPPSLFNLQGPFSRQLIKFMDDWALHPCRKESFAAISNVVRYRDEYFWDSSQVKTIYPASVLEGLEPGKYGDYLFTASRLETAKRVDLIIEGFRKSNTDKKLIIAGTGPRLPELQNQAAGDDRISFAGYVSNERLVEYYKNALGIIYTPLDEDYGYITVEAMQCAKAVITVEDSGGALEFVEDGVTGYVAASNPSSLAQAIDVFCDDPKKAAEMGAAAAHKTKDISWETMVAETFSFGEAAQSTGKRMLALSTYEVFQRQHGGQLRVFNLHKNLSRHFDCTLFCVGRSKPRRSEIGNMAEVVVNVSQKHLEENAKIEKKAGIPVEDITMAELLKQYSPELLTQLESEIETSDIIFLEHPYLAPLVPRDIKKPVVYDAHNVEYLLKEAMLEDNETGRQLLEKTRELEQYACDISSLILACSEQDAANLQELFGVDAGKITLLPNGFDCGSTVFYTNSQRENNKQRLNMEGVSIATFIGSYHRPNIEAAEQIITLAGEMPDIFFIVMGGAGLALKDSSLPDNMVFSGIVDENVKNLVYSLADLAINPMINGSGTNLKLAEYMCYGIPVITTETGARGYDISSGEQAIICGLEEFPAKMKEVLDNREATDKMCGQAVEYIRQNYDWAPMVQRALPAILNLLS